MRIKLLPITIVAVALSILVMLSTPLLRPLQAIETARQLLPLLSAATTGASTAGPNYGQACRETAIYVRWSAGTSAGVVTIETASDTAFTGTWAPLTTVTWTAANKEDVVQITGVSMALRTRISTTITGGTVSTWLVCN